jgi:hypothetical protein
MDANSTVESRALSTAGSLCDSVLKVANSYKKALRHVRKVIPPYEYRLKTRQVLKAIRLLKKSRPASREMQVNHDTQQESVEMMQTEAHPGEAADVVAAYIISGSKLQLSKQH